MLEAVARHGAFLLEDDWMRDFDLGPPSPPPLASMDDDGHVIYLRSLSKPVAPGLRIAGLAARGPVLARLRLGRISDDLFVAPVLQQVALDVLTAPGWVRHLGSIKRALRERRDALAAAIAASLPECDLPLVPAGGVHLWLRLPERWSGRRRRRPGRRPRPVAEPRPDVVSRRAAWSVPAAQLLRSRAASADQGRPDPGRSPRGEPG